MGEGAVLGKEAVLAASGRAGEKSELFEHPAVLSTNDEIGARG